MTSSFLNNYWQDQGVLMGKKKKTFILLFERSLAFNPFLVFFASHPLKHCHAIYKSCFINCSVLVLQAFSLLKVSDMFQSLYLNMSPLFLTDLRFLNSLGYSYWTWIVFWFEFLHQYGLALCFIHTMFLFYNYFLIHYF